MSVQAGMWNLDGESVDREFLVQTSQSLSEYGPDGEWTCFNGPVGMLYRPFHTTPESRLERQPRISESGKILTWDGRLDNRDELIKQLVNVLKDDQTDVAIVAAAVDRWGTDCFAKLVGDWALAIWDPREQQLTLARDYIGIRHLYYYPEARRILWCNHLAALAMCGDRLSLCDEYVAGYLAADPDAHLTPYAEIHSVPPGKFVQIRLTKTAIRPYWVFNPKLKTRYEKDAEYEEQYRHLFRQSVRRRLRTDSSVLADLSGGFDSSSIVCIADDVLCKEGAVAPRVDTFSLYDSNEPGEDDLPHLARVEDKRGRAGFHSDMRSTGDSLVFEYPTFVASPVFTGRTEVQVAVQGVLKRCEYRVGLSGQGGDDVNGQGLDPRAQMADLVLQLRFVELARQLTAWSLLIRKRPWIHLFFQTLTQLAPLSLRAALADHGKVEPWVTHTFAKEHRMSAHQVQTVLGLGFLRPTDRDAVQTIASLSQQMTNAGPSIIEKRYPYLDQNLVEFLMTIPRDQLLRPGQRRHLMRRALADILPSEILARKTKASANRCYSISLEKHWAKVESVFCDPVSSRLGYVDKDRIREALLALKTGQSSPYVVRLLRAVSLEFWLRDAEARGVISTQPPTLREAGMDFVELRA